MRHCPCTHKQKRQHFHGKDDVHWPKYEDDLNMKKTWIWGWPVYEDGLKLKTTWFGAYTTLVVLVFPQQHKPQYSIHNGRTKTQIGSALLHKISLLCPQKQPTLFNWLISFSIPNKKLKNPKDSTDFHQVQFRCVFNLGQPWCELG